MITDTQTKLSRLTGAMLSATVLGLLVNGAAFAQGTSSDVFEEIVVLAQKRAQNIMDVPVAVSAVTGTQMNDAGIKDMADLQQNVPNLIVGGSQTATTSTFSIRGISSTSNNFGVESSVGLYVDGVYRSRQSSMINDLIDVEAVEVLRGPQGTLFGKNTPAGALSVRTVAPSHDRDAFVDVTAGDFGLLKFSGAANFSLSDNLAMRGTLFYTERDGYVDDIGNANLGKDAYNNRDRVGGRVQFLYEPSDDFNLRVIADYSEIDEVCCAAATLEDGIYGHDFVDQFFVTDPGELPPNLDFAGSDFSLLNFGGTVLTNFDYPQPILDFLGAFLPGRVVTGTDVNDHVAAMNFLPQSKNDDSGISVEFNKTLDSGSVFTSITAFRSFNTYDNADIDFSDVDLATRINDAEQSSISQEFRLAGDFGDGNNYVVGAYYFGQEIDQSTDTIGTPFLGLYLNANPDIQNVVALVDGVAALAGPPYAPAGVPYLPGLQSNDAITQDQDGWAVFGQVDFALGEDFILTLGARYTDETKDIDAVFTQNTPQGPVPDFGAIAIAGCQVEMCDPSVGQFDPTDPATFATFAPFFVDGWGAYAVPPLAPRTDLDDSLSDDQVTGNVKLSWFPGESSMIYVSYATGYKSGGTNTERIPAAFDSIFGPEDSTSFEVGFKGDLGPVRLALTYYDTEFDDFQAQTFTGSGFNLQNAGTIDNTGVEVEMLWRPWDSFEAQIIYTHNEVEFASFEAGTCWDGFPFHTGINDPGLPPGFNEAIDTQICSKTGEAQAYNPEDRFFIGLQQEFNLSDNMTLFLRGEYSSASEQLTDGDLDPLTRQPSFDIINARVGLNFGRSNSSLTFWGRNIGDERYFIGSSDAPIQSGRMHAYPAEPATYGVTFRKGFD